MYDDTVHHAQQGSATISIDGMYSPKIEPETTSTPIAPGETWQATVHGLDLAGLSVQV